MKGRHYGQQFRAETIEPNICELSSSLSPEEVAANAALIAAAPAMYEALKGARAKLEMWPEGSNPEYFPEIKAIDHAIRLAEGKESL